MNVMELQCILDVYVRISRVHGVNPMNPEGWFNMLTWAWRKVDRATAFGCTLRNEPFDPEYCTFIWIQWLDLIDKHNQALQENP